jgi:hypothetical protein
MADLDKPGVFTREVMGGYRPGRDGELLRVK